VLWNHGSEQRPGWLPALGPLFMAGATSSLFRNDYDLKPSRSLAKELENQDKPVKLLIFPSFGASAQDGHELCVRGAHIWSREVFAFLSASMK